MVKSNIAIIGAGMSGLACARILSKSFNVFIYQRKSKAGGRMSTIQKNNWIADIGAPYFTVQRQRFQQVCQQWIKRQLVQVWKTQVGLFNGSGWCKIPPKTRYVGKPSMDAITNYLSQGLNIKFQSWVHKLSKIENKWQIQLQSGIQPHVFDKVIIATPQQQANDLVCTHSSKLYEASQRNKFKPCITAVASYIQPLDIPYDAAFVERTGIIQWIANNSKKPGRKPHPHVWVIQCTSQFSEKIWSKQDYQILAGIMPVFRALGAYTPLKIYVHRWTEGICEFSSSKMFLGDSEKQLYIIGDWNGQRGNVEGAYTSGQTLAEHILKQTKS